jgi:amidohydrolase
MAIQTPADISVLRERVREAIEAEREHIVEVAETIRVNPEFQFEEFMASQLLADHLREAGCDMQKPYGGLETAFRAELQGGAGAGPTVAVLAEYDALRGIGHGCGHNLIGASGLAVAIGLRAVMDAVPGRLVVMGTPAEEGGAGKVILANAGAFDGIDAALMIHHAGNRTGAPLEWPDGTTLASARWSFAFHGKPAHAAADPYNGVNALNAVIETFNGINALRQHVRMDARIHGIITHGGEAVNVVPKYARCAFGIRAATVEYQQVLVEQVRRIAEGAALITGCELEVEPPPHNIVDMRPSYVIGRRYFEHMQAVGLDTSNPREGRTMASTDFANISHMVPSVTGSFAIAHEPIPGHSQQVVDASGSEFGYDQFIKVSTAMALTALDLLTDPDLSHDAQDAHQRWLELYDRS